jgi:hypothetical protein
MRVARSIRRKIAVINFPFSGFEKGSPREKNFWDIVRICKEVGSDPIIVVVDHDTLHRKYREPEFGTDRFPVAAAFLNDSRIGQDRLYVHEAWSVDTCQRWLTGWGIALGDLACAAPGEEQLKFLGCDRSPVNGRSAEFFERPMDDDQIILLPGDIDEVPDEGGFFPRLRMFMNLDGADEIIIGDFKTGNRYSTKDLIDLYGTYPLLALWFPEIASFVRDTLRLEKPRSEFLNTRAGALRELISGRRTFAYEQTLNLLIKSWDFTKNEFGHQIAVHDLGELRDDPTGRGLTGIIDQIERTERLLKMVWREVQFGLARDGARAMEQTKGQAYLLSKWEEIIKEYNRLEVISEAIEATARSTVLNFLKNRRDPDWQARMIH